MRFVWYILKHCLYRFWLTLRSIPVYLTTFRLILLDLFYLFEEFFGFICSPLFLLFNSSRYGSVYGTLPFFSLSKLSRLINLTKDDIICDCGSGKGKCLLYFSMVKGCHVIAIELVPYLINVHKVLARFFFNYYKHTFIQDDLRDIHLHQASVYFVSGLDYSDSVNRHLRTFFNQCKYECKVVSIGGPFDGLSSKNMVHVPIACSWGYSSAYIYQL